jgi:peptide/nickel transport system permease protein
MSGNRYLKRLWLPGGFVALIALAALCAPLFPLPDPIRQDVANRLAGPMAGSWLGRDEFGRDVFSRLLWGARTSLSVAFASALTAGAIGVLLGLIGGWGKGAAAFLSVRSMDIVLCFPPVLLALLVVTLLGPGAATLILVLSVLYLPGFARVTHAEVLAVKNRDYVEATRALGARPAYLLLLESGLSFLGLGVVPPAPSWGLMIRGARATMEQAPLLLVWPCAALTLTILAMNLLCDGLRDALDPRTAGR